MLDVIRERMNYPELRTALQRFCQKWAHARFAVIEDKANGPALIDDLGGSCHGVPLVAYNPQASKYERASMAAPSWEAGLCYLPDDAPWVADFIAEHVSFGPGADHDDQVDAGSQLLIRWAAGGDPTAHLAQFAWMNQL